MQTNAVQRNDAIIVQHGGTGTTNGLMDLQSVNSDGWTMVVDAQFTLNYRVSYLVLGGTDITDVVGGQFTIPATAGAQTVTGQPFRPDVVIMMTVQRTNNSGSNGGDSALTIGAMCSDGTQAVVTGNSNNGAANCQAMSYCTDAECFAIWDGAVTAITGRGTYTSMNSDGFTFNWNEMSSSGSIIANWVMIKGGLWTIKGLLTQTDTTTDTTISGCPFEPVGGLIFSHAKAESAADTPQDDDELSIGAFDQSLNMRAMSIVDNDAAGTAVVSIGVEHDEVYVNQVDTSGAVQGLMKVRRINTNGITCIMDDADDAQAFAWALLGGQLPPSLLPAALPVNTLLRM
jgi:hypothetical protein